MTAFLFILTVFNTGTEVLQTLTGTHLKPSLQGAHASDKSPSSATIKSVSQHGRVLIFMSDLPQDFHFPLIPRILAFREPSLTAIFLQKLDLPQKIV